MIRSSRGTYSHLPIERCAKPRHRKTSPVEALVCGAVLLAAGVGVWIWRLIK